MINETCCFNSTAHVQLSGTFYFHDSLRAQYTVSKSSLNQLHGSDSPKSAEKELNFFFPMEQTVAVIKPDAFGTKGGFPFCAFFIMHEGI